MLTAPKPGTEPGGFELKGIYKSGPEAAFENSIQFSEIEWQL